MCPNAVFRHFAFSLVHLAVFVLKGVQRTVTKASTVKEAGIVSLVVLCVVLLWQNRSMRNGKSRPVSYRKMRVDFLLGNC